MACLQKDEKNALVNLNRLIKIDKGIARQYFLDLENEKRKEMMQISDRLHRKINQLIEGGHKMKALELARVQNLILTLVIGLSLFILGLTFIYQGDKLPGHLQFNKAPKTALFGRKNDFDKSLRCDGTSVGKARMLAKRDGTSVG